MQEAMLSLILSHGFPALPLEGVKKGSCTCGKINCSSPGKHPLKHFRWKHAASSNENNVKQWWEQAAHGVHNFGVVTGKKSKLTNKYLVVLDVDALDHDIVKKLPKTFSYRTGKGGHHYWFWSEIPVKNSVSLVAKQVDIRGTNGYVVTPPSNHINGNDYVVTNVSPITDLPDFIHSLLKRVFADKKKTVNDKKRAKGEVTKLLKEWNQTSVSDIREHIQEGGTIPSGVRNSMMHRLLSSDRAKGVVTREELWNNAKNYHKSLEDHASLSETELNAVVNSVMKYQPYNNQHENVNSLYVRWMVKNGHKLPDGYEKRLIAADSEFFKLLKPMDSNDKTGLSLAEIINARNSFLKSKGLNHLSVYKASLLGKKLREMGLARARTAKCNFWRVKIDIQPSTPSIDDHDNKSSQKPFHQHSDGVCDTKEHASRVRGGFLLERSDGWCGADHGSDHQESSSRNKGFPPSLYVPDPRSPCKKQK